MDKELNNQQRFWDKEAYDFDAIYSGQKSKISKWLDSLFRWDMYERFNFTMENAQPIEGRTFLDQGCGTGRYSIELARRKALKVVGLDILSKMIEMSKQRHIKEKLLGQVSFIQSDLFHYKMDSLLMFASLSDCLIILKNPLDY